VLNFCLNGVSGFDSVGGFELPFSLWFLVSPSFVDGHHNQCRQANSLGTGDATLNVKKTAAKPLQIETWLLLTAYKKSPAPYSIVPSPTPYDLPFSHNTSVTDRRRTDEKRKLPHRHAIHCSTSKTTVNRLSIGPN